MDPLEYCLSKAAPDGSALYYCLLFTPSAARPALAALLALERELVEVVEECSSANVALGKLAYWSGELAALAHGRVSHPVACALVDSGASRVLDAGDRTRLLDTTAQRIRLPQIRTEAELDALCAGSSGCLTRAAARLLGAPTVSEAACEALGGAIERARLLRLPSRAGLPPHTGVPLALLGLHRASPAALDAGERSPALAALRRALVERAREGLERALVARVPRPLAIRGRLALAELGALERSGYVETGAGRGITPLRRLWIAWRCRS